MTNLDERKIFIFVSILNVFIGIIGIVLNTFALYYLIKKRNKNRSCGKLFLINLVVSDILKIIICIPIKIVTGFQQKWLFGKIGEKNKTFIFIIRYVEFC